MACGYEKLDVVPKNGQKYNFFNFLENFKKISENLQKTSRKYPENFMFDILASSAFQKYSTC